MATRTLEVDSRMCRAFGTSASTGTSEYFDVSLPQALDLEGMTHVRIPYGQICNSWYNVAEQSNEFWFSVNNAASYPQLVNTHVTIPPGHYNSVTQVCTALQDALNALATVDAFTVAWSNFSNYVTVSVDASIFTGLVVLDNNMLTITQQENSLLNIGFPNVNLSGPAVPPIVYDIATSGNVVGSVYSIQSPAIAMLETTNILLITSTALSSMTRAQVHHSSIGPMDYQRVIAAIPIVESFSKYIFGDKDWIPLSGAFSRLQHFDIQIRFSGHRPLLYMHGGQWTFTLEFGSGV